MCGVDAGVDIWKEEDAGMKTEVMLLFGEDHERKQKKSRTFLYQLPRYY
jgi:hypothetical protein